MESPYLTQHRAWEQSEFTVNDIPNVILCLKVGTVGPLAFLGLKFFEKGAREMSKYKYNTTLQILYCVLFVGLTH